MQNVLDAMPVLGRFVVLAYVTPDRPVPKSKWCQKSSICIEGKNPWEHYISLLLMQYYSAPREWHTKLNTVGDSVWFLILNYLLLAWNSHGPLPLLTDRFFCGRRSVRFARTVILTYGPLFAVHSPHVEVHISSASTILPRYLSLRTKRSIYTKGKTLYSITRSISIA